MSNNPLSMETICLAPAPREINVLDGTTELSEDLRLVTSNVLPMQRKTMRGILSSAGIRVVANKKKFIVEVYVLKPEELDVSHIPEDETDDYYELEIKDNLVNVRTLTQNGALWGTLTLAWIFRAAGHGTIIPNLLIRDWCPISGRGLMIDSGSATEQMGLEHWQRLMDKAANVKLTHLAIRMFGRPSLDVREQDRLMLVPMPEQEDLTPAKTFEWFSAKEDGWQKEEVHPAVVEKDLWSNIVAFAEERSLVLSPLMDAAGRGTPVPAVREELSARDSDGNPTGKALCLSSDEVRTFLQNYLKDMLERSYPNKPHPVHIDVTGLDEQALCECEKCASKSPADLCKEHVDWLVQMLEENEVKSVVVWNGGQADIHYAEGESGLGHAKTVGRDEIGQLKADDFSGNLPFMRVTEIERDAMDEIAVYANKAWHAEAPESTEINVEKWADVVIGKGSSEAFTEGKKVIGEAETLLAEECGINLATCRTLDDDELDMETIASHIKADSAVFEEMAEKTAESFEALKEILQAEDLDEDEEEVEDQEFQDTVAVRTLVGNTGVASGVCAFFAKIQAGNSGEAATAVKDAIKAAESLKPKWTRPVVLSELSRMLRFAESK